MAARRYEISLPVFKLFHWFAAVVKKQPTFRNAMHERFLREMKSEV